MIPGLDIHSSWTVDEHGVRPLGETSRKRRGPPRLSDEALRERILAALGSEWIMRSKILKVLGSGSVRSRGAVILDALVESGIVEQHSISARGGWRVVRRVA